MSMKWVQCLNHNVTQTTSEKPSKSLNADSTSLREHISGWGCFLIIIGRSRWC